MWCRCFSFHMIDQHITTRCLSPSPIRERASIYYLRQFFSSALSPPVLASGAFRWLRTKSRFQESIIKHAAEEGRRCSARATLFGTRRTSTESSRHSKGRSCETAHSHRRRLGPRRRAAILKCIPGESDWRPADYGCPGSPNARRADLPGVGASTRC